MICSSKHPPFHESVRHTLLTYTAESELTSCGHINMDTDRKYWEYWESKSVADKILKWDLLFLQQQREDNLLLMDGLKQAQGRQ